MDLELGPTGSGWMVVALLAYFMTCSPSLKMP